MPYIKKENRENFDNILESLGIKLVNATKGDLEYCIFKIMKLYMKTKEYRYSILHDVVYAAQHCSDEFRRRYLDKREDEARKTNGEI